MTYGKGYEDMVAANKAISIMYSLGSMSYPTQSVAKTAPENKENTMYIDYVSSDKHVESAKTNYLLGRFNEVKSNVRDDLRKQFGLDNDSTPYTAKDLVERIQAGKFILPTTKEENLSNQIYYGPQSVVHTITWRDPAIVEDQAGYDLANEDLKAAALPVHDAIMLKDNDTALAAINDLAKWKPSTAKSVKAK